MKPLSLIALLVTIVSATATPSIHVSPQGDDAGAGTPESPYRTIDRARDAIRAQKTAGQTGPFTVELASGLYPVETTIRFGAQDSGAEGAPVTYRSREPGGAVLKGAKVLSLSDFRPVTDPALRERLDPSARGKVVAISLAEAGLKHGGPFPDRFEDRGGIFEVFDKTGRLPLSRWPNEGYTTMKSVLEIGDKTIPGVFEYRDERPSRWLKNENVWLKGQWRVGWEDPALKVKSIDPATHTITFATGLPNGIGSKYHRPKDGALAGSGKEAWCAMNLPEEIDQPGEWAIDFSTGTLLVWPREDGPDAKLIVTQLDQPLIEVNGATDLVFEGLILEHSLGDGIVMENVERCLVAGCVVRNIAGRGVVVHGRKSGVLSCDIHDIGQGAVTVSGGDRKSLTMSENFVLNNHLHHYGVLKNQYSAGVHVGATANPNGANAVRDAVGIRIAHNSIHHAPRDAFLYSGNDNIYEFNEIYYCGYNTADVGAFYSWLDWTMRGNVIRYNYMHDTVGGVNPDDGASGNLVHGNIFSGPRIGVWIASGPDNIIRHNIFLKEEGSVFGMDDRGVGRGYATNPRLINRVRELNPTEEPWKSAHPELATMLDNRPELPWRTQFVGNLIVSKNPKPSELKMKAEFKTNPEILLEKDNLVVAEDPGFVDLAGGDLTLREEAKIAERIPGFEPIPFRQIGLYQDAYRTRLPTEAEAARGPEHSPYAEDKDHNFGT